MPLQSAAPAPAKSSHRTPEEILGLNKGKKSADPRLSLELEVDQYPSNPNSGTSILSFWQVVYFFKYDLITADIYLGK